MEYKKGILSADQLQQMLGIKGFPGKALSGLIIKVLEIDKANAIQTKFYKDGGPDFSEKCLKDLEVTYSIPEGQLDRIPAEGGFITVSNHHFGAIDGLILSAEVGRKRPDYRLLTTFMLALIPNLTESFMPVNNLTGKKSDARSVNGIRMALRHIQEGKAVGFFPAGIVGTWQKGELRSSVGKDRVVEDQPWADNISKLIRKSGFPVIPIYFQGGNSNNFHWLGRIHRRLRTARLIHELFNKRGTNVPVYIGQPIPAEEIQAFESVEALGRYLRSRTYALEAFVLEGEGKKGTVKALCEAVVARFYHKEEPLTPNPSYLRVNPDHLLSHCSGETDLDALVRSLSENQFNLSDFKEQ